MDSKTKTIVQAVICAVLVCMIWGGYFVLKKYGVDRVLEIQTDDFSWVYQVDSVETEGKKFVLQGFAFEIDKDAEEGAFEIVLQDIYSGETYFPKMEYMEREDVNEYFLCEYDYLYSGFEATIKTKHLDLESGNYEILLRCVGERKTYQTGTYISKGVMVHANPLELKPLEVQGTRLEKIVENGILRVYRPDFHGYVYQYENELYWIMGEKYAFDENNNTYVQYHTKTTQNAKLPLYRRENNWFYDDLGFYFKDKEIEMQNIGGYRIAKGALPEEYSVTMIWTGNYSAGEWEWISNFRPWYEFD